MRRARSDSITAAVTAAQDATAGPIEPPAHVALRERDWPFWNSIVSARARKTWNTADLENAANLARCKADIERLQSEIDAEGDIVKNERGTQIVNPKHTLLETLSRRAMAVSRMLHVHAEATQGESRQQPGRAEAAQAAAEAAAADDGLIPRIRMVV